MPVTETVIENVFICGKDDTVIVSLKDEAECPACKSAMEKTGWFETGTDEQ